MCNGLPYVRTEGERAFEAANDDAAEQIASLAAAQAGARLCSAIRSCHQDCLFIVNRHKHAYPDAPESAPQGIDARECEVSVLCGNDMDSFVTSAIVRMPLGLLKEDKKS
jgi:hypothetical protein